MQKQIDIIIITTRSNLFEISYLVAKITNYKITLYVDYINIILITILLVLLLLDALDNNKKNIFVTIQLSIAK